MAVSYPDTPGVTRHFDMYRKSLGKFMSNEFSSEIFYQQFFLSYNYSICIPSIVT